MAGQKVETIRANGIDLCVEHFGDLHAPPLFLIMGLGAQMIAWDEDFCRGLAATGLRVIRFDNRDIGLSSKFDHLGVPNTMALLGELALGRSITVPYALRDMAADTVGLMDALGIDKAHIVGASMGGMIGQEIAINNPDRMRSFTSIFSSPGDPRLPQATPEASAALFTPAPRNREGYIKHQANVLKVIRGPHFSEEAALDEPRAIRSFERSINPPGLARQLAAIFKSGNRTVALKSVKVPTLVIHGDADPLVRVEAGKATAAAIPGAKLEIIPKMGHSLPKALWPKLIDLISAHACAH